MRHKFTIFGIILDQLIKDEVRKYGAGEPVKWAKITKMLNNGKEMIRTSKQVQERWKFRLQPSLGVRATTNHQLEFDL